MDVKNIVGVDLGFGWTKAVNGEIQWKQPSVVGEYRRLFDPLRPEDVIYHEGAKQYFIGELAQRQSEVIHAGTKEEKAKAWTTVILLKTALAMVAPNGVSNVVTGLPVDFYHNQRSDFMQLLANLEHKTYVVTRGSHTFDACPTIQNYMVVPQPLGSAMNYLLDSNGLIQNKEAASKKILVIDIGYYTGDLLVLDGMEVGRGSGSPDGMGIDMAYKLIQEYLKDRFGKTPGRYDLDYCIRHGCEWNGYNIRPLVDQAMSAFGARINAEVEGLNQEFHTYIITGGWAETLAPYIRVPEHKKIIMNQMGNVAGYVKIGRKKWQSA
jgi:hypothetical protein